MSSSRNQTQSHLHVRCVRQLRDDLSELGLLTLLAEDGLPRQDVSDVGEPELSESDRLGSHHPVSGALERVGLPGADNQGTDAVGVPEAEDSESRNHGRASEASDAPLVHAREGSEDIFRVDTRLAGLVELVGENVEHQLAVALGVDVTVGGVVEICPKFFGVDEVSIVSEADTVGRVDVEGLALGTATDSRQYFNTC